MPGSCSPPPPAAAGVPITDGELKLKRVGARASGGAGGGGAAQDPEALHEFECHSASGINSAAPASGTARDPPASGNYRHNDESAASAPAWRSCALREAYKLRSAAVLNSVL